MKIEIKDPSSLREHKLHASHIPAPDKKSAEWIALVESIHAEGGVRSPIHITADGRVVDGVWRWMAAKQLQLVEIPCIVVDDRDAATLMVESLTCRKQMTRGAAAYIAIGLLPQYAEAAEARRLRNRSKERTTNERPFKGSLESTFQEEDARTLGERWGVSHTTIIQARLVREKLHNPKIFAAWLKELDAAEHCRTNPTELQAQLRAEFEPLLFNGEKSLWTILQAIAGRLSTADKPKKQPLQLTLFEHGIMALRTMTDVEECDHVISRAVASATDEEELSRLEYVAAKLTEEIDRRKQSLSRRKAS